MFRKKITQEMSVMERPQPITISAPIPVTMEAELEHEERLAYVKLAAEIQFRPAALIKDELLAFLHDNHFPVYPYDKVKVYLDQQFGKKLVDTGDSGSHRHTWGWCPLRQTDQGKSNLSINVPRPNNMYGLDNGRFEFDRIYHGKFPLAAMCLVKDLQETVPGVHFFVSDVMKPQDRRGDPFLAVTTPGLEEMIVIFEWDEPSFR